MTIHASKPTLYRVLNNKQTGNTTEIIEFDGVLKILIDTKETKIGTVKNNIMTLLKTYSDKAIYSVLTSTVPFEKKIEKEKASFYLVINLNKSITDIGEVIADIGNTIHLIASCTESKLIAVLQNKEAYTITLEYDKFFSHYHKIQDAISNAVQARDNESQNNMSGFGGNPDPSKEHLHSMENGRLRQEVSILQTQMDHISPSKIKDDQSYTFFTRPELNLSYENIKNYRPFIKSLLTKKEKSIVKYVRCLLDPRLSNGSGEMVTTSLLDPESAFMPILTNTLKSISGWDGIVGIHESFDLDVTFNNLREGPLTLLFDTWMHYMSAVFENTIMPYGGHLIKTSYCCCNYNSNCNSEDEIDYNTRIYRIVLTENKKFVKKITATKASYPINIPTGKFFDASDERPFSDKTKDVTIRFKSIGNTIEDDILIKEFNDTVGRFNPRMRKLNKDLSSSLSSWLASRLSLSNEAISSSLGKMYGLEKIPDRLLLKLNYRRYPRINPMSKEFEWWANKGDVAHMNKNINLETNT